MGVEVVEESEPGSISLAGLPIQKRRADLFAGFPGENLVLAGESSDQPAFREGPPDRPVNQELAQGDPIVFVVGESAGQTEAAIAVQDVGDEPGGKVTLVSQCLRQGGPPVVERAKPPGGEL